MADGGVTSEGNGTEDGREAGGTCHYPSRPSARINKGIRAKKGIREGHFRNPVNFDEF